MFFLTIGMYLVTFDLIKKKIGAGANFGEGGPEKQLFFLPWPNNENFRIYGKSTVSYYSVSS